jgi:hypothetical protein
VLVSVRPTLTRSSGPAISVLLAACLILGALSLLLPSVPTTDPWGWIVWGRQIVHLDLNTVAGPPSWKPLPALFTAPLSLLGGAAPDAWLVVARAGGLLALLLGYRLGRRLAGPVAGAVTVIGLLLIQSWVIELAFGYSEGLAVALLLWAVLSHLDGRRDRALVLAFLVSLSRPEAWLVMFPYAAWCWWTRSAHRSLAASVAILSPLCWLLPDWWGSGSLFHADQVAGGNLEADGAHPGLHVLVGALGLVPMPVLLLSLAAIAIAARRRRADVLLLGAGAFGWVALLSLATELGYPGAPRFLVPPMAMTCVLAGVGAAWLAALEPRRLPRAAIAVVLIVATVPLAVGRAETLAGQANQADAAADFQDQLDVALRRAGGPAAVLRYGRPVVPAHLWWNAGDLAWRLGVPLDRVATIPETRLKTLRGLNAPAVLFTPLGAKPPDDAKWVPTRSVRRAGLIVKRLASAGMWRVLAIERRPGGSRVSGPRPAPRS